MNNRDRRPTGACRVSARQEQGSCTCLGESSASGATQRSAEHGWKNRIIADNTRAIHPDRTRHTAERDGVLEVDRPRWGVVIIRKVIPELQFIPGGHETTDAPGERGGRHVTAEIHDLRRRRRSKGIAVTETTVAFPMDLARSVAHGAGDGPRGGIGLQDGADGTGASKGDVTDRGTAGQPAGDGSRYPQFENAAADRRRSGVGVRRTKLEGTGVAPQIDQEAGRAGGIGVPQDRP